jgi:hypothetical protein
MKYLEEIQPGDCFEYKNKPYLLTQDFKKNGNRLCISLIDGFPSWVPQDSIIESFDLFRMDKDNNIIAIKERKKTDVAS